MAIRILTIDETADWSDDVKVIKLGGRVFGVYLYNDGVQCEMTSSYALHHVTDVWELNGGVYEKLSSKEQEALANEIDAQAIYTDPVQYIHCHVVDDFPERPEDAEVCYPETGHTFEISSAEDGKKYHDTEEDWMESAIESVREVEIF